MGKNDYLAAKQEAEEDFEGTMQAMHEEFMALTKEAHKLEKQIAENMDTLLEKRAR